MHRAILEPSRVSPARLSRGSAMGNKPRSQTGTPRGPKTQPARFSPAEQTSKSRSPSGTPERQRQLVRFSPADLKRKSPSGTLKQARECPRGIPLKLFGSSPRGLLLVGLLASSLTLTQALSCPLTQASCQHTHQQLTQATPEELANTQFQEFMTFVQARFPGACVKCWREGVKNYGGFDYPEDLKNRTSTNYIYSRVLSKTMSDIMEARGPIDLSEIPALNGWLGGDSNGPAPASSPSGTPSLADSVGWDHTHDQYEHPDKAGPARSFSDKAVSPAHSDSSTLTNYQLTTAPPLPFNDMIPPLPPVVIIPTKSVKIGNYFQYPRSGHWNFLTILEPYIRRVLCPSNLLGLMTNLEQKHVASVYVKQAWICPWDNKKYAAGVTLQINITIDTASNEVWIV